MQKRLELINNQDGMMVLMMVTIMLVAVVITGVVLMKTATLDTKIVGNQRVYKQDFYAIDSGLEQVYANPSDPLSSIGIDLNATYTYLAADLPDILQGVTISVDLEAITNPPIGSGYSVTDFRARHYMIDSSKGSMQVRSGSYKIFPKQ